VKENSELYILWTNDHPVTAEKMVLMYGMNSMIRGWWKKVTLIVWGAAALLVSENEGIQKKVKEAQEKGIHMIACKACADQLGVTEILEGCGIEVVYTGEILTNILKSKEVLITI
jgi:hypothetical protein